jgi:hypothetical protein
MADSFDVIAIGSGGGGYCGATLHLLAAGRYNHPVRAEDLLNATETLAAGWGPGRTGIWMNDAEFATCPRPMASAQ